MRDIALSMQIIRLKRKCKINSRQASVIRGLHSSQSANQAPAVKG